MVRMGTNCSLVFFCAGDGGVRYTILARWTRMARKNTYNWHGTNLDRHHKKTQE